MNTITKVIENSDFFSISMEYLIIPSLYFKGSYLIDI